MIKLKRVYEAPNREDGFRILVDRLWPRGVSKQKAKVGLWLKEIAPTDGLRKWFSHDAAKWKGFQKKYGLELKNKRLLLQEIKRIEKEKGTVTLLFAASDAERNNAVVLRKMLEGE